MQNPQIWRPFTQEKTADASLKIVRGSGAYLFDKNGHAYLDLISSWWVNIHGHANEEIADAIYNQAKQLEHVIFAGFTHDPAEQLCQKLSTVLCSQLCKFFFSDNGSTAVEIALKMAYQYWINLGITGKNKFISFTGGYHGDTVGAMGLGSGYHETFRDLCLKSFKISWPETWIGDVEIEKKEEIAITQLKKCLEKQGNSIAAMIVEPMIQGASGMRMVRPIFMKKICSIVRAYNIIIIFDEVMTGFYRTGKMFAYEHFNINSESLPDILCVSKGLTGGFLPLSLTITSHKIFDAFLDDSPKKMFVHGHSYTANPLGCAAALASFDILQKHQTLNNINMINTVHQKWINQISNHAKISKHRILGTIAAFSIKNSDVHAIKTLERAARHSGIIIRPIGDVVYLIPPYCISKEDLQNAYEKLLTESFK